METQDAVFPDDGEGGLLEVLGSFADAVVAFHPEPEKYAGLLEAVQALDTCAFRLINTSMVCRLTCLLCPLIFTLTQLMLLAPHR